MTITVYGAGAIGGVTGAELVRAGHDVLLVDRAVDHVAAMNAHGLTIDRGAGSLTVPVRAITPEALGPGLELVLLAVKSQDTPAALEVLAPRLATDGAIVSLQNGLNRTADGDVPDRRAPEPCDDAPMAHTKEFAHAHR